ncbi:aspartate aminotransferase family protein [Priestia endophytica]|uniref:aminotransferase family protein n=1 Tax=Priestia endophytica TaxID=135735 RepID=UPI002E1E46FA|nr:aminotransferase class III-fold pyridoxal phosphate-dependent enzyme [Priestia endophytica]MED4071272.1 aminotransferase class III-fold pyridoxal phosphate-dependent enzyme [Priestia endophytica]
MISSPLIHPLHLIDDDSDNFDNIVEGKGIYVKDANGRVYIDGISGLWNVSMGYNHPEINESIIKQLYQIPFVNLGERLNPSSYKLAESLLDVLPKSHKKICYTCTGSESVELAIKIAREYNDLLGNFEKKEFIAFDYSYHGTYYGSMSASGLDKDITQSYSPKVSGFHFLPTPFEREIDRDFIYNFFAERKDKIAAIIIEPIIGSGGIVPIQEDYMNLLMEICEENNILIVVDEVATGFGRTGKLFGFEHYNMTPDIICMAKGINSGYIPMGAVSINEKIVNQYIKSNRHIEHLSTQNGNPLACAAGNATLKIVTQSTFLEDVKIKGEYFIENLRNALQGYNFVSQIRGRGLMIGIEIKGARGTFINYSKINEIIGEIKKKGVLVYSFYSEPFTGGISLFPPLIITKKEIDRIIKVISKVFRQLVV